MILNINCRNKILNFYENLGYYIWYHSTRSDTRPECGSTCIDEQQIKCMHTDLLLFFEMLLLEFFFSELELQVWKESRNMQMKGPH